MLLLKLSLFSGRVNCMYCCYTHCVWTVCRYGGVDDADVEEDDAAAAQEEEELATTCEIGRASCRGRGACAV